MKNTVSIFFLLFVSQIVFTQGWERFLGEDDKTDQAQDILQTPDGGFLISASLYSFQEYGTQVFKLDEQGNLDWTEVYGLGVVPNTARTSIFKHPTGNYLLYSDNGVGTGSIGVRLISPNGNLIWEVSYPDLMTSTAPIGFMEIAGGYLSASVYSDTIYQWKIDYDGNLLWEKYTEVVGIGGGGGFAPSLDSGYVVANIKNFDFILVKFDSDGNLEWTSEGITPDFESGNVRIAPTADGGYVMASDLTGPQDYLAFLKMDENGNQLWNTTYSNPVNLPSLAREFIETSDGSLLLCGDASAASLAFIIKLNPQGNFVFYRNYSNSTNSSWFNGIIESADGSYVACGYGSNDVNSGDAYIVKTTTAGSLYSNVVQGKVAFDENETCVVEANDQALEGWLVKAVGDLTYYDISDTSGHYFIELDTGNYVLELFPPNDLWSPCDNQISFGFSTLYDTLETDFPTQAAIDCPAMQVDIGLPFLRRCFDNTLTVQYCNLGTEVATDATIEVTLDSLLGYVSSTITPSGPVGNTYTFPLGDVDVNECGSFQITAFVDCDAMLGQSLCMEAHAFPDSICGMPFNWSGASMVARAKCEGDTSVVLELENVGSVPTSQPLEYIVIEDQIIFLQDSKVFNPMDVETFSQSANGSTWRVACEQEPNHPGNSIPTAFVEGCGTNDVNTFSIGFLNEHPMADGDGFVDIDCEEVVASFDPNDKTGYPIGYDDQHYIEPNTDLEYRIRFQNTGTDTAFNVVIRDILSQLLDPTTLRPGSSSHPYEFELRGDGIAIFKFPNIMLPDSNVNEPLSHGFVNFKISQQRDLPPGEVIYNSAAIYFDFNEPVITNETFHTIEEDFILATFEKPGQWGVDVNVYPNPFFESAVFEVKDLEGQRLTLHLFDGLGRLVRMEKFDGNQLVFQREGLGAGVWFFQIALEGQPLASGKLVVAGQ